MTKLDVQAHLVSVELLEAIAIHPGLKRVDANPGFTNLSSVRPELLTQALNRIEHVQLGGTSLTPQQLNALCCGIIFDPANKIQILRLSGNDLRKMEPVLLAEAVFRLNTAMLFRSLTEACIQKLIPHGVAIMDTLGRTSSQTRHLYMSSFDLAPMDPDLFSSRRVCSKLVTLYLIDVELTPQQANALFIGIKKRGQLPTNFNKMSFVEPSILVQAMTHLHFLSLKSTRLTPQQLDAIFDALQEPGRLQGLTLSGNNLSSVVPTKIWRVNALRHIIICHSKLTMKQVKSIIAGSLVSTKLKKVRWTEAELDGTSQEWERLHALVYEATLLGIHSFQDTKCSCICAKTCSTGSIASYLCA